MDIILTPNISTVLYILSPNFYLLYDSMEVGDFEDA